jgi:uncharacterized protein with HEPN domain
MDRDPGAILDIVLACRRLRRFVADRTFDQLQSDEVLQYAVLHATALIGEAASRFSPEFRQAHSEIPCGDIIGTRNRIIHGYENVKFQIVWEIATTKVGQLLEQLEPLLPQPPEPNP